MHRRPRRTRPLCHSKLTATFISILVLTWLQFGFKISSKSILGRLGRHLGDVLERLGAFLGRSRFWDAFLCPSGRLWGGFWAALDRSRCCLGRSLGRLGRQVGTSWMFRAVLEASQTTKIEQKSMRGCILSWTSLLN